MSYCKSIISLLLFYFTCFSAFSQNNFWVEIPISKIQETTSAFKQLPKQFNSLQLDTSSMSAFLRKVPVEFSIVAENNAPVISLPMPDGKLQRFAIYETIMMEQGLAASVPIKTFGGRGIDDPTASIKIDYSPWGFHAMILSSTQGSVFIDPYSNEQTSRYISYYKKNTLSTRKALENDLLNSSKIEESSLMQRSAAIQCVGGTLRTYRLALACTGEYARAVGGNAVTQDRALAAMTTTMNRVNGIFETEVAVRMVFVDSIKKIIFTNPSTDPFSGNNDANTLINESQTVIVSRIGTTNFDIGHTFSTGGGGLAELGVVCNNSLKAKGVTGALNPSGDAYDVDFVAHEIGHQFGATHTFNAATGNCQGNGSNSSNVEPGSGSTIMAYAGICGNLNNLQPNGDPYFHAISIDQIVNYTNNLRGNTCAVRTVTGNTPPTANAGQDYIIPKSTPFVLSGSGSDPDNDLITYSWEGINTGGVFGDYNNPVSDAPIFRSYVPQLTPVRYFPRLTDLINNTTSRGELLPSYERTINFRLTVRDNRAGGGGVCGDDMNVQVDGASGPFLVTYPNSGVTWSAGSFKTIEWDVALTNKAPVNCTNVSIELSTDGGQTYPITLVASTPNDGEEEILVPGNITTRARIRIKAVDNIFFDISNANFTIRNSENPEFEFNTPKPAIVCSGSSGEAILNTSSLGNFVTPIQLSASGTPAGTTVQFSSNPINPGTNVAVTLQGISSPGNYSITITGTAGNVVKTRVLHYSFGFPIGAPGLKSPANNSVINNLLPTFTWGAGNDNTTYNLQISETENFTSVIQSVNSIIDSSYTVSTALKENTIYYWRISSNNTCGKGPNSSPFRFKTAGIVCGDTLFTTDVPLDILDRIDTVNSTLSVDIDEVIADVDVVGLKGKHTYIGDLTISLISPAKTRVILVSGACGNRDNFNINFDDEASSSTIPCPPTGGATRRPLERLASFDGEMANGTWTLQIIDHFDSDAGQLENWGLRICTFSGTPLPVDLLRFIAKKGIGNTVALEWSTASEQNSAFFIIERSKDGSNYAEIGKLEAGNQPSTIQHYLFNDVKPVDGINYYRLKQVDKDGRFKYSGVVEVLIESQRKYRIYPNPAINFSTVKLLSDMKNLSLQLTDVAGRMLYQKNLPNANAGQEIQIPVQQLRKGLYFVSIITNTERFTEKIVVQ